MSKMYNVEGHTIDLIRRALIECGCDCPVPKVAGYLHRQYPYLFGPNNWAGCPSTKKMFMVLCKHFTLYYKDNSVTDLWVRINSDRQITITPEVIMPELTPRVIVDAWLTDSECIRIAERYNISPDLREPARLKAYFLYYLYRLIAEDKLIATDNAAVCNTGLYYNGIHPAFLLVRRTPDGRVLAGLHNRNDGFGRKIVENLGNVEPQAVCFPREKFDETLQIFPEYGHILGDHPERLPESLIDMVRAHLLINSTDSAELSDSELVAGHVGFFERMLMGAIYQASVKLRNRTVEPVQIWWKRSNKMAWMIPLTLGFDESERVALVMEETMLNNRRVYRAHTIIGLDEAYVDARLVGPVTAGWLSNVNQIRMRS